MRKSNFYLIILIPIIIVATYLLYPKIDSKADKYSRILDKFDFLFRKGEREIEKIYTPSISLEKLRKEAKKFFEDEINPITGEWIIHEASPGNYTIIQEGKKIVFTVYDKDQIYKIAEFSKKKYLNQRFIKFLRNGFYYHDLKKYEKAIDEYNKAIEINPKNSYAYKHRGDTYRELKQYNKALKDWEKAISLGNSDGTKIQKKIKALKAKMKKK